MSYNRYLIIRCVSVFGFQGTILTALTVIREQKLSFILSSLLKRYFFFLIWQPPILPYRLQYSTFGRLGLNRRVRDGYGCFP